MVFTYFLAIRPAAHRHQLGWRADAISYWIIFIDSSCGETDWPQTRRKTTRDTITGRRTSPGTTGRAIKGADKIIIRAFQECVGMGGTQRERFGIHPRVSNLVTPA